MEAPVAITHVHTHGAGSHILGKVEFVAIFLGGNELVGFKLAHKTGTEGGAQFAVGHGGDKAVEVDFAVDAPDDVFGYIVPEITLDTGQGLDGDATEGTQSDVQATERVVDTQVAVFVGTKNHATAELLVEVTGRDADELPLIAGEIVGDSHAFVAIVKTQHGV